MLCHPATGIGVSTFEKEFIAVPNRVNRNSFGLHSGIKLTRLPERCRSLSVLTFSRNQAHKSCD